MVFDGASLPGKRETHRQRRGFFNFFQFEFVDPFLYHIRNRMATRELGLRAYQEGKIKDADKYFSRSVVVTPEMAHEVILVFVFKKCLFKWLD